MRRELIEPAPRTTDLSPPELPPAPVRKGPALIIVGLALVIVLAGAGLALAFGGGHRPLRTATRTAGSACPSGPDLRTVPAGALLRRLGSPGAVPGDIATSLFVPSGSALAGTRDLDQANGQFDRELDLRAPGPGAAIASCYRSGLVRLGWQLSGTQRTTAENGRSSEQLLAQRASRDGYYWEVGVTVEAGGTSGSAVRPSRPTSTIALRLLEVPDAS